jgi:hypothetical protein
MSYSYSFTESMTFTVTHARHMAAKVATDLKRMQRFYGKPSDGSIADYETEATEMLRAGYLDTVTYGFKKDGKWIEPTLRYTARDLAGAPANDDDPGKIRPGADVGGASFYSYMTYTGRGTVSARPSATPSRPACRFRAAAPPSPGSLATCRTTAPIRPGAGPSTAP